MLRVRMLGGFGVECSGRQVRFSTRKVELHDITRPWGDEEVPLRDWHPDPLLAKD